MPVNRAPIFAAVKQLRDGKAWTQADVDILDRAIDEGTGEQVAQPQQQLIPPTNKPTPAPASKFMLSNTSKNRLQFLHPRLRSCVELAIGYSSVDFGVNQTLRTIEEQKAAVAKGNSRTMKSKHLKQPDGWVWAVDLAAYVDGKISWDMPNYAAIAFAMDRAATELGIAGHVRWGCAWDRVLSDFGGEPNAYMAEVFAYEKRHAGSDLLDGPHFEWVA